MFQVLFTTPEAVVVQTMLPELLVLVVMVVAVLVVSTAHQLEQMEQQTQAAVMAQELITHLAA
jgi:hypothetical protein